MHIGVHLYFDGQCRSAFEFYGDLFGGTIVTMLTYGESPMAAGVATEFHDRILHATLRLGEIELAGADLLPDDYRTPQGFAVLLGVATTSEAERVFHELASGGEIRMPFQPTFWSAGFGVVVDRFGVPWEINSAPLPSMGKEVE